MPSLLLINPNTSVAMTERMAAQARLVLAADVRLHCLTAKSGHPVIASRAAYADAAHAVLEMHAAAGEGFDAVVIGCFGDPGLEALRAVSPHPVYGLAEASIQTADELGAPFAILTVGPAWVAILEERVLLARVRSRFVGVFATEGTGLDASRDPHAVAARLQALADEAATAGARAIILGGAALAGFASKLKTDARLIDCLAATMAKAMKSLSA